MRHRTIVTLAALGMFVLFFALDAKAHTTSEIESWEAEWAEARGSISGPLAPALLIEFDRARFWFEQRHQCFYHQICPPPQTDSVVSLPASSGVGNQTSDVERWRGLVASYFPTEVELALCVIRWESGGNPDAYNPSSASGLFQVKQFWFDAYGGDPFDPANNVRVAALVRSSQGWSAWQAVNRGRC